ncbi:hypothetical protein A9G35_03880 [Gilliamella sp. Choc5-1]|uniref:hypothetical protein n=1 Tax=Gilliamella sp. Choc5-1 TaxID=3120238 RepID=UPI00080E4BBE|nr:hypothetical protein [Gilliamella apicola]OCG47490.1 hypothetical protein A9G35_03880 [Gilliamella apicola]
MSGKLLIKISYTAIIVIAILMSKLISENFIVIPKIVFWFECFILYLAILIPSEKFIENWNYLTNFHIAWNLIYAILSTFFIAYEGWFVLLCFYIPAQIFGIAKLIKLNQMVANKELADE